MARPAIIDGSFAIGGGASFSVIGMEGGKWGVRVMSPGKANVRIGKPVEVAIYEGARIVWRGAESYSDIRETSDGISATAIVQPRSGLAFHAEDFWSIEAGGHLAFKRHLRIEGGEPSSSHGFVSGISFTAEDHTALTDARFFIPGAMYGAPEHVLASAPGGLDRYRAGTFELREDQLAAPLLGMYFGDGSSVALLDPEPRGRSVAADFAEPEVMLADARIDFGAMGAAEIPGQPLRFGYWYPGTRGYFEDSGSTEPTKYRRCHPVRNAFVQDYALHFRFGDRETFHEFYRSAWRWSWSTLQPRVNWHDLELVRRLATDMLAKQVIFGEGATGLPNSVNAGTDPFLIDQKAVIGFTGKCIEASVLMLMEAERDSTERGKELRRKALAVIDQFLKLKVGPPEGEGFQLDSGQVALALPRDKVVYLRSFSDDMKLLLYGCEFERKHGREHPSWIEWCREFADWLLTQQSADGGFPRSWEPGTGKFANPAPQSSYNPVPMLLMLTQLTGDVKYRDAAVRAAEFCWLTEHANDHFVGGTIDNPNVLDKEAATLSLEAYLALYEETQDSSWLQRARHAADFAETYIYLWNVPMPEDADDSALHWKKGVPTIGMNGINTTMPGAADPYLAFDVDRFARLARYTGDGHYIEVARLLLHNTKSSFALPGRLHKLPAAGWQTEHVFLGPPRRGMGMNKLWLPWVSTCQLHGIVFTQERVPELFEQLANRDGF